MVLETLTNIWNQYWWAILIALGIIVLAVLARKGLLGARLTSLFAWPPNP